MTQLSRCNPDPSRSTRRRVLLAALALMGWLAWSGPIGAQLLTPPAAPAPAAASTAPNAAPTQPEAPQPIAVADIVGQAELATQALREAQTDLATSELITAVNRMLPPLRRDIEIREAELRRLLIRRPSLDALRSLQPVWDGLEAQVASLTRDLTRRATRLDRAIGDVTRIGETWDITRKAAIANTAPPEVINRAGEVIELVRKTRADLSDRRARLLALQTRAAELSARIGEARAQLRQASEQAVTRLFVRDSPPVWDPQLRELSAQSLAIESRQTYTEQLTELREYWARDQYRVAAHGVFIALLVAGAFWVRQRVRGWVADEPRLARAAHVFDRPVAVGLLLGLLASGWFYEQAPRLVWMLVGAAVAVPTVTIVRRIVDAHLVPAVYAVATFYLLERVRAIAAPSASVSRMLFAIETVGVILFLLWTLKSFRARPAGEPAPPAAHARNVRLVARLGVVLLVAVLALNALGMVRLADLISSALTGSAYLAMVFYAATTVINGLVMALMRTGPLAALRTVQIHRQWIAEHVGRWVRRAAVLVWLYLTLDQLALWHPLRDATHEFLSAPVPFGSLQITGGQIVAFVLSVWIAVLLSRLVRFVLEEEVFPKLNLARGLPYAITTMVRYAILILGGVIGLAALGVDMTKFTILAGALSVGLGFGLQNIVNNFVSGLIVLFERPVKVGDVIQMGDITGQVERIGIRASVIRIGNGAEVIVPNGKLISDQVTNWTLSTRLRRLDIPMLTVAADPPSRVERLLIETARKHPDVVQSPPPEALLTKLGADAFEFELRVWTSNVEDWARVRSDLISAVGETLRHEQIALR